MLKGKPTNSQAVSPESTMSNRSIKPIIPDLVGIGRISGLALVAACLFAASSLYAADGHGAAGADPTAAEAIDDEEPGVFDDGSGALHDRYHHLDLKNIKPLSLKEEESLLGNWGDTEAEYGD